MPETISHKQCSKCKEIKEASAFVKVANYSTGLASWCMKCKNTYGRKAKNEWKKKPESKAKINQYNKEYRQTEKGKAFFARRRERIRFKNRARRSVKKAIRSGRLVRPSVCEKCGINCRAEAHHYLGYAFENRFDVQWLCLPCHRAADSLLKE